MGWLLRSSSLRGVTLFSQLSQTLVSALDSQACSGLRGCDLCTDITTMLGTLTFSSSTFATHLGLPSKSFQPKNCLLTRSLIAANVDSRIFQQSPSVKSGGVAAVLLRSPPPQLSSRVGVRFGTGSTEVILLLHYGQINV